MFPTPNFRHSLTFFRQLAAQGRPDLAADNAAADGRLVLAAIYYRRAYPVSLQSAYRLAAAHHRKFSREKFND